MRLNHFVAVFAVVACLSFASSALAIAPGACCSSDLCFHAGDQADCDSIAGGQTYLGSFTTCAACNGAVTTGACCDIGIGFAPATCFTVTKGNQASPNLFCQLAFSGAYQGDGSSCVGSDNTCPPPPPVPAVSEWGMASLVLVLLTGLAIKFRALVPKRA